MDETLFLISILIPVYNVEKYIARCLESLFANTIIDNCEVIIVDDCSPDGSMQVIADVLDKFLQMRENVVLRSHDCNRGSAAARNTALLQAHGKYVICVDSDDWVEPDYLEKLYAEAERTGADIVGCGLIREEAGGGILVDNAFPDIGECVPALLTGRLNGWLWQKMFRRDFIAKNDIGWVEGLDMCEDLLFSVKAFCCAKKISFVHGHLYHYNCQNSNSLTRGLDDAKIRQILSVDEKVEEFLAGIGRIETYRKALLRRKAFTKLWICCDAKKLSRSIFRIYTDFPIYKYGTSMLSKTFLFLTHYKLDLFAYLLIWTKRILIKGQRL